MNRLKNKDTLKYYVLLSVTLWIVILSIYIWWAVAGKAVVEYWDGLSQHFSSFVYFGNYARDIIKNAIVDHNFSFPLYDFSIGYGQDILGTLHYYIIGDPFSLLAVLAKPKYAEFVFAFAIMLRIFLSGISFSIFARSKNFSYFQSFIATFVYVFSGYVIIAASRHPYFINPMIYLPLLCLGVDHIFEKKGYKLFIFMTFISIISNFYFFYMLTILVFFYAIYQYLQLYSIKDIKLLFSLLTQSIVSYLIGVLMGAVIFVPVVNQFLNTGRGSIKATMELLYPKQFYSGFVNNFISPTYAGGSWTLTSYLPIIMIIFAYIIYSFTNQKRARKDFIALGFLTLLLLFPYVGSFFNGFSYSTNRWIFGYSFFWAFLTAKYLPDVIAYIEIPGGRKKLLKLSSIVLIISFIFAMANANKSITPFIGIIFLLLYLSILLLSNTIKTAKILLSILTVFNALVFGAFHSNIKINPGLFNSFAGANIVKNDYWAPKSSAIKDIQNEDTDWFRYELSKESYRAEINNAIIRDTNSTNFYFSLSNKNIFSFNKRIGNTIHNDYEYYGLDSRAELGTLANSKYYAKESTTSEQHIPYGYTYFKTIKKGGKMIQIYKNSNFLPFGYTYDSYIDIANQKTNPMQLMDSMTESVIVDESISGLRKNKLIENDIKKLDYQVTDTKGVEIDGNQFTVSATDSEITLTINNDLRNQSNQYLFLNMQGINFPNIKHGLFGFSGDLNETNLKATYGTLAKDFTYRNKYQGWYVGIEDSLMNLGPITDSNEIKISFKKPGVYKFKSIDLLTRNYATLDSTISKLRENTLQDVKFSTNTVTGKLNLEKEKLLLLTIPYDSGWTAYDNGKKISIVKSNFMYSGLVLKKGAHQIQLKYRTPGLTLGIILTLIGWGLFILLIVRDKRKQ